MAETDGDEFFVKGPDAQASGVMTEDGFLVREGAIARKEIVRSASDSLPSIRKRLIEEGVLAEENGQLRFTKDYLFRSPSGAAAAVLGRTANGWNEWKRADGSTLSQAKRVSRDAQAPLLNGSQRQQIIECQRKLLKEGQLPTAKQLDKEYSLFRERFGPSVLAGVDGEALLTLMHDHGNRDGLVYWLEFKNDDEFDTSHFGGIGGGSALKFRVFRRKETGIWQAADDAGRPTDISVEEAIEIARSHRNQLIAGCKILEELSPTASDEDYAGLQDQLDELAPDVSRLAWGHKYFSLIFPTKLDDLHSPAWQRFHLLKLLQLPPEGNGRYACAGRFVAAAREVGLSMNHFTSTLNTLHGGLHHYWRIGTHSGKTKHSYWEMMQKRSCIAVGWPKLGDISWVEANQESRAKLKKMIEEVHPNDPSAVGRDCKQLTYFIAEINEGDIVVAAEGMTIQGIGRVTGGYEYHPEFDFPHQRRVEWLDVGEWKMPQPSEGLQSTVRELKKFNENILAIEKRIQAGNPEERSKPIAPPVRLTGIPGRIQSILERKGQVILYGPPGTGKTYWAERAANDLASLSAFGKVFDALDESQKGGILGNGEVSGLVRLCCFHPAYGYEDFLEGYRPQVVNGQASFELRDGVFKTLCKDAAKSPGRNFYLIVDEINRGDIPRIFGELLTTLEKDKRGKRIILPVSREIFWIPKNVFLLATMNTADRSISLLDTALRRRFGFIEMMPDSAVVKDSTVGGIALRAWLDEVNKRIRENVGRDARNLQIGHSYLMLAGSPLKDMASLRRAIRDDIIPLLEEYCYEDYTTLAAILGEKIVDVAAQRIRSELFDDGQEDVLTQALLAPFAEMSTSSEAISSEESQPEADENGDEEP